ncbi:MAG: hypothetical protein M1386_03965 [Candidatus Thermoplasmatota archaeon]|nr:hypothetical protein [Candidatus Thermoplasmatota archaeon]
MTEPKGRYPILEGSVRVVLNGRDFAVRLDERKVSIIAKEDDIKSSLSFLNVKVRDAGEIRKIAKLAFNLGFTVRLEDSRGTFLSFGKGIWSPMGHFSFKPRIRKYLKDELRD